MNWALRRQLIFIVIFILLIGAFGFFVTYPALNKAPSCTDGKQDGTETGIDCGGSCVNACLSQVDPVSVLWARSFEVVPGRYNAVAYLENHNKNVAVDKITYRFRFADENNIYIGMREGTATIPPSGNFAIFEPGIDVGNSVPIYTTFEFTETPDWITVPQDKIDQLQVLTSNINLATPDTNPILTAIIKNNSFYTIPDVNAVAILYDASGNAISASSTYFSALSAYQSKNMTFTWPEPFSSKVVAEEILPLYDIFSVTLN